MTQANARSCGVSVAALIAALLLISVPVDSVSAQTTCPTPDPSNVVLLPGYSITAVASCLNFPTAMTFQNNTIWITEEGTATSPPAVKQIDNMGNVTTILTATMLPAGSLVSPLTGIVFHESNVPNPNPNDSGWLWLVHRQTNSKNAPGVPVGAISRFRPNNPVGTFQTVISGFPSFGDHPNSQLTFGADGRAYINGAAPTNSGVVGPDNGWAPTTPTLHDFPGVDIELSGNGYQTLIPWPIPPATVGLDPAGGTSAAKITQPFMAFGGGPVPPGTVVKAPTPANPQQGIIAGGGTVYSFDPSAANPTSTMRLEAWGFRNPYGIGFDPFNNNQLFVSNNGADVRQTTINGVITIRGSRPIDNDYDDMFVVQIGQGVQFFGHPDFFHDPVTRQPLPVTDPRFCPPPRALPIPPPPTLPSPCSQFAFSDQFRATLTVQPAFAEIPDNHGSANMFDFSRSAVFGYQGDIFIAETGSIHSPSHLSPFSGRHADGLVMRPAGITVLSARARAKERATSRRAQQIHVRKGSIFQICQLISI
jgi:hypothetical protein